ncbi:chorismate--pyruvate lyase family protein [Rhodoferax ferrireducens]|uniref:chorismate--pyruvate lyase family protein n=1 Tax=Rhodoferax ferrireducens TaxID=192843 RepID=UPI00130037C4|nr:chorismate lyase [Rhodoferax ferrireducens]
MYRGDVRRWLGASGSLSARLAGAGQKFSVQVLAQGRQRLHPEEARALGLPGGQSGYVREVLLRVDGIAVVFARSVTAHAHSLGPWRSIRGLGTRPLADVLFKRMGLARTPLEFCKLKPASRVRRHAARAWQQATGEVVAARSLPARRSVFTRRGAPLLVMEVFADGRLPWCWPAGHQADWTLPVFKEKE